MHRQSDAKDFAARKEYIMKGGESYSKRVMVAEGRAAAYTVEGASCLRYGTLSLVAFIEGTAHEVLKDEIKPEHLKGS